VHSPRIVTGEKTQSRARQHLLCERALGLRSALPSLDRPRARVNLRSTAAADSSGSGRATRTRSSSERNYAPHCLARQVSLREPPEGGHAKHQCQAHLSRVFLATMAFIWSLGQISPRRSSSWHHESRGCQKFASLVASSRVFADSRL